MSDRKLLKLVMLAALLSVSPWAVAAFLTWDASFEATPANTDPVSQGDDRIRDLKENVRERLESEHYFGTLASAGDTGRHREGSAVAFYAAADPVSMPFADAQGLTTLGAADEGRLAYRSDTGQFRVYTGSAWAEALTALAGNGSNRVNLLSGMQFLKAGADAMDIHAHDARHRLGGTDGAWTNAPDGMPFAIQQILVDSSVDGAACGVVNTTANASQVFGDAGDACLSIATGLNFTGRTGNSRILVFATSNVNRVAGFCEADMVVYLDSVSTQLGVAATESVQDAAAGRGSLFTVGYSDTVSAASHEVAVHLSDANADGCDIINGSLVVVDLGNST